MPKLNVNLNSIRTTLVTLKNKVTKNEFDGNISNHFPYISLLCGSYLTMEIIGDVCQKTDDNNLCVKSLRADPRSASADKKCLARIMVQLSQAKASDILNQIDVLLKQTKEPILKQCLEVCRDTYDMTAFRYSNSI
ncbi:hypothetical protein RND71_004706 [Anisodus tanguticus]|uniref:Pectinesterase inhibitor domain-containing protein n=1 Tax=Anisodus tanguticus TaxID=243964 RepID=A0AAE1SQG5_9SOLA|nr:hypothetical protein RND71_004706 [Anisodus tanguticus]